MAETRWSDGYMTEVDYETYFFAEQAPATLDFVCMQMARRPPVHREPFNYCELGCGMGLTTLVLGATHTHGRFWGVDFNPSHVVSASRLAAEAGVHNVTYLDAAFDELERHDLPQFDYITLHGVWSWVSDDVRAAILAFIRSYLRPGGAVYVSYNCAVGWEGVSTVGRMLREYVRVAPGPLESRIEYAIGQMGELAGMDHGYFGTFQPAKQWFERLKTSSRKYLAHEYLNEHWRTYHFPEVSRQMAEGAKLSFVGSADVLRNFDHYSLSENGKQQSERFGDRELTEMLKDVETGWGLRRDVFLRGAPGLSHNTALSLLTDQQFISLQPREKFEPKIVTPLGETTVKPEILGPIADALCERPHGLGELMEAVRDQDASFFDTLLVCTILLQNSMIAPLPKRPEGADSGEQSRRLNRTIARRAVLGEQIPFLAAPLIGSAVAAQYLDLCCYELLADGFEGDGRGLAAAVLEMLGKAAEPPQKDGKPLTVDDLEKDATELLEERVPMWRTLGAI